MNGRENAYPQHLWFHLRGPFIANCCRRGLHAGMLWREAVSPRRAVAVAKSPLSPCDSHSSWGTEELLPACLHHRIKSPNKSDVNSRFSSI